jgi:galactitol-specific phosphotransferase system IIC component
MPKNNQQIVQNIRNNPLQWIVQIVGIIVVIANLYIASQLAPLKQDLAILIKRVEAVEINTLPPGEVKTELRIIDQRLDRIENKLDAHILKF